MAPGEHDDDVEDRTFRRPLPPDDRLWRHPSELDEKGVREDGARRSVWARLRRLAEG